jgi:hypothetical protein
MCTSVFIACQPHYHFVFTAAVRQVDLVFTAFIVPVNVAFCITVYGDDIRDGCTQVDFVGGGYALLAWPAAQVVTAALVAAQTPHHIHHTACHSHRGAGAGAGAGRRP